MPTQSPTSTLSFTADADPPTPDRFRAGPFPGVNCTTGPRRHENADLHRSYPVRTGRTAKSYPEGVQTEMGKDTYFWMATIVCPALCLRPISGHSATHSSIGTSQMDAQPVTCARGAQTLTEIGGHQPARGSWARSSMTRCSGRGLERSTRSWRLGTRGESGAHFGVGRLRHLPGFCILARGGRILSYIARLDSRVGRCLVRFPFGQAVRLRMRVTRGDDIGSWVGVVRCRCHVNASTHKIAT